MKRHSTNYFNTFIRVADDCPVVRAGIPPDRIPKSAARKAYDLLQAHPYQYTSDDIIFLLNGQGKIKEEFFSKGQPCFRVSALTKRYGWGVHSDEDGKIAIYARESPEYAKLVADPALKVITAARNKRS